MPSRLHLQDAAVRGLRHDKSIGGFITTGAWLSLNGIEHDREGV